MKPRKIWIDEIHGGSRYGLKGKILIKKRSPFQEITIMETENHGNALMLDGCWMTSDKEEKYYHECLVHPALSSLKTASRVLIIGGGDGGTARECLKYSDISLIDLVEIDKEVIELAKKHLKELSQNAWEDKRLKINICDGLKWVRNTQNNYYDVVFIDCSDPSEISNEIYSLKFYEECKRITKREGIVATQSESPESFQTIHIEIMKSFKQIFNVSATMYSFVPFYPSGIWSWTFGSENSTQFLNPKYKHIDFIENSCDIWNLNYQKGGFQMMPSKILKELNKI